MHIVIREEETSDSVIHNDKKIWPNITKEDGGANRKQPNILSIRATGFFGVTGVTAIVI